MSAFPNNVGLSLKDSTTAKLMIPQMRFAGVYMMQPKYNIISQVTNKLSEGKRVTNRKFERSKLGNIGISVTIATRTASGLNLVLVCDDVEFQQVRVGDMVRSNSEALGMVESTTPGQITISPWTGADGENATSFAATDFAAATKLSVIADASKDADSTGKESLLYTPNFDYNYAGVIRDAIHITRDDLMRKTYEVGKNGGNWAFAQEGLLRLRFSKLYEQRALLSARNQKNGKTTPGGLMWALRKYGQYFGGSASSVTQSKIHEIIYTIITESGASCEELLVLCGGKFLKDFQENIGDRYITYVGKSNTIGGESVRGIDVYEYAFMGTKIKLVHYFPFDDPELFPEVSSITGLRKASSTAMFLNMSQVETTEGMVPTFEKFYYDSVPCRYYYLRGLVEPNDADPSNAITNMGYTFSANDRDGFTAGILCDDGFFWNGLERCGLYELIS